MNIALTFIHVTWLASVGIQVCTTLRDQWLRTGVLRLPRIRRLELDIDVQTGVSGEEKVESLTKGQFCRDVLVVVYEERREKQ